MSLFANEDIYTLHVWYNVKIKVNQLRTSRCYHETIYMPPILLPCKTSDTFLKKQNKNKFERTKWDISPSRDRLCNLITFDKFQCDLLNRQFKSIRNVRVKQFV